MDLTSLLSPTARIIDVGTPGPDTARWLSSRGSDRYLGLVPSDELRAVRQRAGDLKDRFHTLTSVSQVVRNNADVLLLRPPFDRCLWSVRDLAHVRYVAVEAGSGLAVVERRLARLTGRLAGRMTPVGVRSCGAEHFEVIELAGQRAARPRHYLSPLWGVTGFARRLDGAGLRYIVLRWFENLPELERGEDLDLLVADEDVAKVQAVLAEEPGTIPVDVYSVTGLPGSAYQEVAYYPPGLARQLLDRAVVHRSGVRVPAREDHLRSLAYHALYHKGPRSGLPSSLLERRIGNPEHDYAAALQQLAKSAAVTLPESMEDLDEYLEREGWRPPLDTLLRLAGSNSWIDQRFFPEGERPVEPPELAVFLVRERATAVMPVEDIVAVLDQHGFEILTVQDLDGPAKARCASHTRGGNWGRGPFAESGGGPATVIVALHHAPRVPGAAIRGRYARLTNADVLLAKRRVRELMDARLEPSRRFNPLHSSDSEMEAWEYLWLALPDQVAALRAEVDRRRAENRTEVPVVKRLSRGRRARVEVVHGERGLVVRKTFAAGYRRHMERELQALRELGPRVDAVPRLLETGPDWFTCPFYENTLTRFTPGRRLLPLRVVREMVAVLRRIHELGFDLVDAKPQNFLLDPEHGLKVVDFEFLYRYPGDPPDFAESYCFVGVPEGFPSDVPVTGSTYDYRWRRFTGLSHEALLASPWWSQHVQRVLFRLRKSVTSPRGPGGQVVALSQRQARRVRRHAAGWYLRWASWRARSAVASRTG